MGIPNFVKWLGKRYNMITTPCDPFILAPFDNLYIDMNHIIHICSHDDDEGYTRYVTEEEKIKIFERIVSYVNVIYEHIKPSKNFFLGVDGVAPRAKMNQQRCRRFNKIITKVTEEEEEEEGESVEGESRSLFHPNCISPGTKFMYDLDLYFQEYILRMKRENRWKCENVVYSGVSVPGEGEHKFMNFIRERKSKGILQPNETHCCYGHDADLILLSLATHEPYFVILKESTQSIREMRFSPKLPIPDFELIHLSMLRDYLEMEIRYENDPQDKHKMIDIFQNFDFSIEHVIDDFVFITFLLGNDFLPHIPTCDIYYGAIQEIICHYKKTVPKEMDGYLVENMEVRWDRFLKFLDGFGEVEDLCFWRKVEREVNFPHKEFMSVFQKSEKLSQEEEDVNNNNNHNKKERKLYDSRIRKDRDERRMFIEWKKDYYTRRFNNDEDLIRRVTREYLKGLEWNLKYYYSNTCPSWKWAFQNYYAPIHSDMASELRKMIEESASLSLSSLFEFEKDTNPFTPFQQLLAVLPPSSSSMIPQQYRFLLKDKEKSPLIDYFPEDYEIDVADRRYSSFPVILLPFIDEKKLLESERKFVDTGMFSEIERKRNEEGRILIFKRKKNEEEESEGESSSSVEILERRRLDTENMPIPFHPCPVPGTCLPGKDKGCRIEHPSFFFFPQNVIQVKMVCQDPYRSPIDFSRIFIDGKALVPKKEDVDDDSMFYSDYVDSELKVGDHVFTPLPYPLEGIIDEIVEDGDIPDGEKFFYRSKFPRILKMKYGIVFSRYRMNKIVKIRILGTKIKKNVTEVSNDKKLMNERERSSIFYKYPVLLLMKYDRTKYTSRIEEELYRRLPNSFSSSSSFRIPKSSGNLRVGSKVVPLRGRHFGWDGTIKKILEDEEKFVVEFRGKKKFIEYLKKRRQSQQQQQEKEDSFYFRDPEFTRCVLNHFPIPILPKSVQLNWTYIQFDGKYAEKYVEEESESEEYNYVIINEQEKEQTTQCEELVRKEYNLLNLDHWNLYCILSHIFVTRDTQFSEEFGYMGRRDNDLGLRVFSTMFCQQLNGHIRSLIHPIKSYYTRNAFKFSMSLRSIRLVKDFEARVPQLFSFLRARGGGGGGGQTSRKRKKIYAVDLFNEKETKEETATTPTPTVDTRRDCEKNVLDTMQWIEGKSTPDRKIFTKVPCGYSMLIASENEQLKQHLEQKIIQSLEELTKKKKNENKVVIVEDDESSYECCYKFEDGVILHDYENDPLPMNWSFSRYADIGHLVAFIGDPKKYNYNKVGTSASFVLERGVCGVVTGIFGQRIRCMMFRIVDAMSDNMTRWTINFLEVVVDRDEMMDLSECCVMRKNCDIIGESVKEFYKNRKYI